MAVPVDIVDGYGEAWPATRAALLRAWKKRGRVALLDTGQFPGRGYRRPP